MNARLSQMLRNLNVLYMTWLLLNQNVRTRWLIKVRGAKRLFVWCFFKKNKILYRYTPNKLMIPNSYWESRIHGTIALKGNIQIPHFQHQILREVHLTFFLTEIIISLKNYFIFPQWNCTNPEMLMQINLLRPI